MRSKKHVLSDLSIGSYYFCLRKRFCAQASGDPPQFVDRLEHLVTDGKAEEDWNTTKKLRPGLPKAPRAQLVLKALLTLGDISDQLQAAMILGVIEAQEPDD